MKNLALVPTQGEIIEGEFAPESKIVQFQQQSKEDNYWDLFSFYEATKAYFRHIRQQPGATTEERHTYKAYKGNLRFFLRFLKSKGNAFPSDKIMQAYIVSLRERGTIHLDPNSKKAKPLSDASIQAYLAAARLWLKQLAYADVDVPTSETDHPAKIILDLRKQMKIEKKRSDIIKAANVKNPKPQYTTSLAPIDRTGNWLSQEEAAAVINSIVPQTWVDFRDIAIFMLGFYSSLRVSSIQRVTQDALKRADGNTWTITLVHKRNKYESVAVDAVVIRAIQEYIKRYNAHFLPFDERIIKPDQKIWRRETKNGNPYSNISIANTPMQTGGLRNIVSSRSAAAGAGLEIDPHDMRRSWAAWTRLLDIPDEAAKAQTLHDSMEQFLWYRGEYQDYSKMNIANYEGFELTSLLKHVTIVTP